MICDSWSLISEPEELRGRSSWKGGLVIIASRQVHVRSSCIIVHVATIKDAGIEKFITRRNKRIIVIVMTNHFDVHGKSARTLSRAEALVQVNIVTARSLTKQLTISQAHQRFKRFQSTPEN